MRRRSIGLALVALGCVRTVVPAPPTASHVAPTSRSDDQPVAPALAARLREIADALGPRGVRLEDVVARGFIAQGGHVTTGVDVAAGRCVSLVALSTAGVHDLDARLFDPDGDMLVEDVESDAHPTVQLCASEARRVFHVINAYEGQGAFLVARFVTDRRGLDEVARVVGGRPGTAGETGAARGELERRVTELRDGIARRGFQPTGDPTRLSLGEGGSVRAAFPVTPDRCYTFGAFADGELQDVDLRIIDPSGEEVARDVRRERDGVAQLCPTSAVTLSLEAAGVAGRGHVLLQAWSADASMIGGASALWLGERLAWSGSARPLDETIAIGRERVRALGFAPAAGVVDESVTLSSGDVVTRTRALSRGSCTGVLASAGRGAGRVSLDLHADDGALLARGAQGEGGAFAVACGSAATRAQVRVGLESGSGEVRLMTFSATPPSWLQGIDVATAGEAFAATWQHPSPRWRARAAPERLRVGGGARVARELERPAGRCVRIALVSGRGAAMSLVARGEQGARIASNVGDASVLLRRCGAEAERIRVEAATEPAMSPETDALWMVWESDDATASPSR